MPRYRETVPIDDYVLDVLMPDLVGHDHQPGAFLVYLYLYLEAQRQKWSPIYASLRKIGEATGLSKSPAQIAVGTVGATRRLKSNEDDSAAAPRHRVPPH